MWPGPRIVPDKALANGPSTSIKFSLRLSSPLRNSGRGDPLAVEDFPAVRTLSAWMQVGDGRFDSDEIRRLYDRSDYQLRKLLGRTKGVVHPAI